jgi:methyltransferase (TIGR00027 family)
MKRGRASYTAEGSAAIRALEALRPPGQRVFEDPFAGAFLSLRTRWRLWPGVRALMEPLLERKLPGILPFTVARARWIDDLLIRLAPDLEQIVILGAGYDTTFARHPDLPKRLPYFEVDHPATAAAKRARIARHPDLFGKTFEAVRTVPIDFEREDLSERLHAGGYREALRTAFVWSGVTMYLERAAVEATLCAMGRAAPGSRLMADVIGGRGAREEGSVRTLRYFQRLGEALRFMIDPEEMGHFLAPFGFEVVEILEAKRLQESYFVADDPRRVSEHAYLVDARVLGR